jgi:hypothetical protein
LRLLRYSSKPMHEFAEVGFSGWPIRNALFGDVSVFLSSAIELVADWQKEDFLERVMGGLTHGGLMITNNVWPDVSIPTMRRVTSRVKDPSDYSGLASIHRQDGIRLGRLNDSEWSSDDLTMIARAVQMLLNARPFRAKHSSTPTWWRFRADPMGKKGQKDLIADLCSHFRFYPSSIRIFNADSWIGLGRGILMMLSHKSEFAKPYSIWGMAVDDQTRADAREAHDQVAGVLSRYGKQVSLAN